MVWVLFSFFLEFNYFPTQQVLLYQYVDNPLFDYTNTYSMNFGIKMEFFDGWVFIEGSDNAYFTSFDHPSRPLTFCPNFQDYKIGIGINIKDIFSFGWEHSCYHPVMVQLPLVDTEVKQFAEGSYDRLYARVDVKMKVGGK